VKLESFTQPFLLYFGVLKLDRIKGHFREIKCAAFTHSIIGILTEILEIALRAWI